MSPARIRSAPPHPLTVIAAAITWARARGYRIRFGSFGVHCVSRHAADRWELDPRAGGVDPLGAAILHRQPMATDPYAAAAEAVNAPEAWIYGFQEGIDAQPPSRRWDTPNGRVLYAAGREAAARFMLGFRRRVALVH